MTKTIELKHPNGFVIGVACYRDEATYYDPGWRFYPKISGRHPSRKSHPTADGCLPAWARRYLHQGCSFLPPAPQPELSKSKFIERHLAQNIGRRFSFATLDQLYAEYVAKSLLPGSTGD